MATLRKPHEGILNIVRFNWHLFVAAALAVLILLVFASNLPSYWDLFALILSLLILMSTIFSLLVSFFIYDRSGLYRIDWLQNIYVGENDRILNIHAGFDETSKSLKEQFPYSDFQILDFYDASRHTEISIKRARKHRPPIENTISVNSRNLSMPEQSADVVFLILAAHEIRDKEERQIFFRELKTVLKKTGRIVVVEHLRDIPNFLAFNIGFFHFFSRATWLHAFNQANLEVDEEIKHTPFLTIFFLKNGNSS